MLTIKPAMLGGFMQIANAYRRVGKRYPQNSDIKCDSLNLSQGGEQMAMCRNHIRYVISC